MTTTEVKNKEITLEELVDRINSEEDCMLQNAVYTERYNDEFGKKEIMSCSVKSTNFVKFIEVTKEHYTLFENDVYSYRICYNDAIQRDVIIIESPKYCHDTLREVLARVGNRMKAIEKAMKLYAEMI